MINVFDYYTGIYHFVMNYITCTYRLLHTSLTLTMDVVTYGYHACILVDHIRRLIEFPLIWDYILYLYIGSVVIESSTTNIIKGHQTDHEY